MIIGLNIGHDASLALTDEAGEVVAAVSEERFNRIKGFIGFPHQSLEWVLTEYPSEASRVDRVIVGTLGDINFGRATSYLQSIENTPDNYQSFGIWTQLDPPGWAGKEWLPKELAGNQSAIRAFLQDRISAEMLEVGARSTVHFARHHDAHAASGFFPSGFDRALVLSLDGQGDGESGFVGVGDRSLSNPVSPLARIPSAHSLGHLYQAVTNRYGFNPGRHEGKITGLAAYGGNSALVEQLSSLVRIVEGKPEVSVTLEGLAEEAIRQLGSRGWRHTDFLDEFFATIQGESFADLAFAIQDLVERSVAEIVEFWLPKSDAVDVAVSGGLFANVKINQRVSELVNPGRMYVYPQMGDGGLATGGVWNWLARHDLLVSRNPHASMFTGPMARDPEGLESSDLIGISRLPLRLDSEDGAGQIAEWLARGLIVGVIYGRMEFGPRALGNRSLLADPRDSSINGTLNARLRRTEFMPFAPLCMEEEFADVFEIKSQESLEPYRFMTMTCRVRESWRSRVAAVVHVDGTARPQVIRRSEHPHIHLILTHFLAATGVPCLVNTSFNVHEEPIVMTVFDGLRAMRSGACDVVVTEEFVYFVTDNMERLDLWSSWPKS